MTVMVDTTAWRYGSLQRVSRLSSLRLPGPAPPPPHTHTHHTLVLLRACALLWLSMNISVQWLHLVRLAPVPHPPYQFSPTRQLLPLRPAHARIAPLVFLYVCVRCCPQSGGSGAASGAFSGGSSMLAALARAASGLQQTAIGPQATSPPEEECTNHVLAGRSQCLASSVCTCDIAAAVDNRGKGGGERRGGGLHFLRFFSCYGCLYLPSDFCKHHPRPVAFLFSLTHPV